MKTAQQRKETARTDKANITVHSAIKLGCLFALTSSEAIANADFGESRC